MHAPLGTFLDQADSAAQVMAHGRLLLKLSRRFSAIAPAGLARSARVANFKAGKIVIHADNGAVAVKLRQMSQRLCEELAKGGFQCGSLEVKVQPRPVTRAEPGGATQKPLSGKARGTLQATASGLPPGGLRTALEQLLARAAEQK